MRTLKKKMHALVEKSILIAELQHFKWFELKMVKQRTNSIFANALFHLKNALRHVGTLWKRKKECRGNFTIFMLNVWQLVQITAIYVIQIFVYFAYFHSHWIKL